MTNHPGSDRPPFRSEPRGEPISVSGLIDILRAPFHPQLEDELDTSQAVRWLISSLEKGLTRVYAVNLESCFRPTYHPRFIQLLQERTGDCNLGARLSRTLQVLAEADPREQAAIESLLYPIVFEVVDGVLAHARAAGRDAAGMHLAALRVGHELVMLIDPAPHYEWMLFSLERRLREALEGIGCELYPSMTQSPDWTLGETLEFLGYHFHLTKERGKARVRCRRVGSETWGGGDARAAISPLEWLLSLLRRPATASRVTKPARAIKKQSKKEDDQAEAGDEVTPVKTAPAAPPPPIGLTAPDAPLIVVIANCVLRFLKYRIPFTSWNDVRALFAVVLRQWRLLVPLVAGVAVLCYLYFQEGGLEGTVTYRGNLVDQGRVVVFEADAAHPWNAKAYTTNIEHGRFRLSGLAPGRYSVSALTPQGRSQDDIIVEVDSSASVLNLELDRKFSTTK